jgi:filamentous hemagglutinin
VANDPPTQHRYLYARANPTKYVDKDGRCSSAVNQIDPYACDRHIAGFTDPKVLAENIQDIKNEAAAYVGIGQAVGDIVVGTVQTAKDIGGVYVEAATGGEFAKGSMLRLKGQVDATYNFVTSPVESVQLAIYNHNIIVAEMEARGDIEGAIQERARFASTGLLSVAGGGATGVALKNKFSKRKSVEPPPSNTSLNDFTGIVTESDNTSVKARSFEDVDVQRNHYQFWTQEPIVFNGNKVFQRNDLIDPSFIVERSGLTNLQLMKVGRAPIGFDGKPINLHHMTQRHDGAIAEATQTFHQQNTKVIHINPSSIPSGINRSEFNKWRATYWENRSKDFEVNSNEIQN